MGRRASWSMKPRRVSIAQAVSTMERDQLRNCAHVKADWVSEGASGIAGSGIDAPSATELSVIAPMELLERHLEQAERNLAAQHAGALRMIGQLLGTPGKAAESVPAQLELDFQWKQFAFKLPSRSKPAFAIESSLPGGQLNSELVPQQIEPPRPESCFQALPPPMEAPSMSMPGQMQEPQPPAEPPKVSAQADMQEQEDRQSPGKDPTTSVQNFDVSPSFRKMLIKRSPYSENRLQTSVALSSSHLSEHHTPETANRPEGYCSCIIQHPNTVFRAVWDILCMVLVLYDMIMVPFDFFEPHETAFMFAMTWIIRIFWTFDIPISFTLGYVTSDGTIEMSPAKIAAKYLRTWFFLDIIVTTIDWSEEVLGSAMEGADVAKIGKTTKVFRIIRLARLCRLMKVGEIVSLLFERLPSEKLVVGMSILKLIVIMLGAGHLVACAWFWIGIELRPSDRENWNWLQKFDFEGEQLEYKYIMCLRWALSHFAGGMDEVTPVSLAEHIFACLVSLFAFWSGTLFLSIMTSHFTQLYILVDQQSQQVTAMRRYLAANNISKALTLRVIRNAQHCLRMRQPTAGLLELVSEPLQIEMHHEMYFPMLCRHPFFLEDMEGCPFLVRRICHEAMTMNTFSRDDVIFHFGEAASQMHIVRNGTLVYSWGTNDCAQSENLTEGKWLSEPTLWTQWSYRGVLHSYEDSIVFAVAADIFQAIVCKVDPALFNPAEYARSFVRKLNRIPVENLTDLPMGIRGSRESRSSGVRRSISLWPSRLPKSGMMPDFKFWTTSANARPSTYSDEFREDTTERKPSPGIFGLAKVFAPRGSTLSLQEGSQRTRVATMCHEEDM